MRCSFNEMALARNYKNIDISRTLEDYINEYATNNSKSCLFCFFRDDNSIGYFIRTNQLVSFLMKEKTYENALSSSLRMLKMLNKLRFEVQYILKNKSCVSLDDVTECVSFLTSKFNVILSYYESFKTYIEEFNTKIIDIVNEIIRFNKSYGAIYDGVNIRLEGLSDSVRLGKDSEIRKKLSIPTSSMNDNINRTSLTNKYGSLFSSPEDIRYNIVESFKTINNEFSDSSVTYSITTKAIDDGYYEAVLNPFIGFVFIQPDNMVLEEGITTNQLIHQINNIHDFTGTPDMSSRIITLEDYLCSELCLKIKYMPRTRLIGITLCTEY